MVSPPTVKQKYIYSLQRLLAYVKFSQKILDKEMQWEVVFPLKSVV